MGRPVVVVAAVYRENYDRSANLMRIRGAEDRTILATLSKTVRNERRSVYVDTNAGALRTYPSFPCGCCCCSILGEAT